MEFAFVAIAYNAGHCDPSKGLKQGHYDDGQYYGEAIFNYLRQSRKVTLAPAAAASAGRFVVAARDGLQLRKGPGLDFGITKTLDAGTEVHVAGFDGPHGEWARVDLQGDGLVDGHLHSAFLQPTGDDDHDEEVAEPQEA
jgi:hypothetical protein